MNSSNLLLNVHYLHPLHFLALIQLSIIVQRGPFPPCSLLFANDWLASHTVKDVTALRSKAFEINGYIGM